MYLPLDLGLEMPFSAIKFINVKYIHARQVKFGARML